jgi:hypothetical protein
MRLTATITTAMILVILLSTLTSGGIYIDSFLNRDKGPPKTDWYEVEDWEVTYCSNTGGLPSPEETGYGTMSGAGAEYGQEFVAALQGERTDIVPSFDNEESVTEGKMVYEVSWFVQTFQSEDLSYEVYLVKKNGFKDVVSTGSANFYNPARGYYSVESEANYTDAYMKYYNEDINEDILVPIAGVEAEAQEEAE